MYRARRPRLFDPEAERAHMIEAIRREVQNTSAYLGKRSLDPRVMQAIGRVPRHEFVPESIRSYAYLNRALPLTHGQTISQPYIVAVMTDALAIEPSDTVLEIGTGCGYQTAVLAELADTVCTIELIPALAKDARRRLQSLGYTNIEARVSDGYDGWPDRAPFDAIIVTAAPAEIPEALVEQLEIGGRLVVPVGAGVGAQDLLLGHKDADGELQVRTLIPVAFVRMERGCVGKARECAKNAR